MKLHLITLFILACFGQHLFAQEPSNWNIKLGAGRFERKTEIEDFRYDVVWDINIGYRFKNTEFGVFYQKTSTMIEMSTNNYSSGHPADLQLFGGSFSYHLLPLIFPEKKIASILDLYAVTQAGISYVADDDGYAPTGTGAHIFLGLGAAFYPLKRLGVFYEYGYRWFTNNNTVNLNQPQWFVGISARPILKFPRTESTKEPWSIQLSTMIVDPSSHQYGDARLGVNYGFSDYWEIGVYGGLSYFPVPAYSAEELHDNSYTPDFGVNANLQLLPLFASQKSKSIDVYATAKAGGYYYAADTELNSRGAGYTVALGAGSSFFLIKYFGLFMEYNYGFSDFKFYKGNSLRVGIFSRF